MINCPYCGKLTDPKLDSCPHCGGYVQKKMAGRAPEVKKSAGQTCPNCQALIQDGDIICVGCGTNLLTGQKIAEENTRVAKEDRNLMPWLALGGVVVVVALVAGVFAYNAFTRDPVKRAVQLAYSENYLEASNMLSRHLENRPDDARAHFELGRIQWKMGRLAEAALSFENAYANDSANTDAGLLAVMALGNSVEPTAVQRQTGVLMDLTRRFPDNGDAWYLLALVLGAQNDVEGQIDALKNAVAAGVDKAGVRRNLAVALGMTGDFATARQELQAAERLARGDADTAAAAGFVASMGADYGVAREQLERAISAGTVVTTQAQTRLGLLLLSQGRAREALEYLGVAAENDRRNPVPQFFHAVALEADGNEFEALTALEAVANTQHALAGEASVRAAGIFLSRGNYDRARDIIVRAENAGVNTAAFHTVRGRVHVAGDELERAAQSYARARQIDPDYPAVYLETGLLHIRQQEFRQAIENLEKYLARADHENTNARAAEVATLVDQLKQAGTGPARPAYNAAARRSVR